MTLQDPAAQFLYTQSAAYTHGLEEIYTLEAVDIKTIRRIEPVKKKEIVQEKKSDDVLSDDLPFSERFLLPSYPFSYSALLQDLTKSADPLLAVCLFDQYKLSSLISLGGKEQFEFSRFSREKKELMAKLCSEFLLKEGVPHQKLQSISERYLVPWMRGRKGLASCNELMERLWSLSESQEAAFQVLRLLSDLYAEGTFLFGPYLHSCDREVFASEPYFQKEYSRVVTLALSYFYNSSNVYPLDELKNWMQQELSSKWDGFQEGFIERALRLSSSFHVQKGDCGRLLVTKS